MSHEIFIRSVLGKIKYKDVELFVSDNPAGIFIYAGLRRFSTGRLVQSRLYHIPDNADEDFIVKTAWLAIKTNTGYHYILHIS